MPCQPQRWLVCSWVNLNFFAPKGQLDVSPGQRPGFQMSSHASPERAAQTLGCAVARANGNARLSCANGMRFRCGREGSPFQGYMFIVFAYPGQRPGFRIPSHTSPERAAQTWECVVVVGKRGCGIRRFNVSPTSRYRMAFSSPRRGSQRGEHFKARDMVRRLIFAPKGQLDVSPGQRPGYWMSSYTSPERAAQTWKCAVARANGNARLSCANGMRFRCGRKGSPFQGYMFIVFAYPRRCPGLASGCAVGAGAQTGMRN